jgi:hypothetical protein
VGIATCRNFTSQDHRFEWTRAEFETWAQDIATRFGYAVRFAPVGAEDEVVGAPTQMAVFTLHAGGETNDSGTVRDSVDTESAVLEEVSEAL